MNENQREDQNSKTQPSPLILNLGYIVIAGIVFFLIWQNISGNLWGSQEKYLVMTVVGIPIILLLSWIWKKVFKKLN